MALWRGKPEGSVVRSLPDWNIDLCAAGWGLINATWPIKPYVSLFNNDPTGRQFWIYGVFASASQGVGLVGMGIQGTFGSHTSDCQPVVIGGPTLPGQIFTNTSATDPGTAFGLIAFGDQSNPLGTAPMFVLPAGFSLVTTLDFVGSPASVFIASCGFYYLVK